MREGRRVYHPNADGKFNPQAATSYDEIDVYGENLTALLNSITLAPELEAREAAIRANQTILNDKGYQEILEEERNGIYIRVGNRQNK